MSTNWMSQLGMVGLGTQQNTHCIQETMMAHSAQPRCALASMQTPDPPSHPRAFCGCWTLARHLLRQMLG
jgi:hypothetical protein